MSERKEAVLKILAGQKVDIIPVLSVCQYATYELMEKTGAYWPEAHYDAEKMAQLAVAGSTILGLDAVRVPFCQTVEPEAYGASIHEGGVSHIPSIEKNPYNLQDIPEVPEDFLNKGRIPVVLNAIKKLKSQVGKNTVIMGSIVGPFSVAASLLGIGPLLKASLRTPEKIKPFLEVAEASAELYAQALIEAGAEVIVIEDMMASLDMISPKMYRQLALPYEKQLISKIKVPVIIHICGKLDMVMEDIASTGAAAISVESKVDIPKARAAFQAAGINTPIIGAVNPVDVLLDGSEADVKAAVEKSIQDGVGMVSPDCAVAPNTQLEKLHIMVRHTKEFAPHGIN